MQQRPRKPGDQAPPPRPTHRNPGPTASTHVKDASGVFCVHDGDGNILELPGLGRLEGLSRDDARKAKDVAVTRFKFRRAGIREMVDDGSVGVADDTPATVADGDAPNPDPVLERQRLAALAAARPIAQAAQARADAQKAKHAAKKPVQRAAGWEPPPPGTTGARQAPKPTAKDAPVVRAPGFEAPTGGAKSTAPETAAVVEIDPIDGEGSLELDGTDDVAEILSGGGDLETEVKRKVEEVDTAVIEACKTLTPGAAVSYFPDDADAIDAKVIAVHAPTCITLQLPSEEDEYELVEKTVPSIDGSPRPHPTITTDLHGQVLKAVMLAPAQGKRAGTWLPIL